VLQEASVLKEVLKQSNAVLDHIIILKTFSITPTALYVMQVLTVMSHHLHQLLLTVLRATIVPKVQLILTSFHVQAVLTTHMILLLYQPNQNARLVRKDTFVL